MRNKRLQTLSAVALIVSILPLTTLIPVFLQLTLPEGVNTVWARVNVACVAVGLILSVICVKSSKSRSTINIVSTTVSAFLSLLIIGIVTRQKEQTAREIAALQHDAEKARSRLAGLYESFITGVLTQTEYRDMKAGYHQTVMDCVEKVRRLQERQDKLERQTADYASLAERLSAVEKSSDLTAAFVGQIIESVTVNGSTDISVKFAFESSFDGLMEALDNV